MTWQRNKKLVSQGSRDLKYLPRERCGWDCTLVSLAYGLRRDIELRSPDLCAWAARHGLPASGRYHALGADALVLWHGTSKERADKITAHGLFHKRGLWTTLDPRIAHTFCRGRSERFATDGAVVCLVLDRRELVEGRDYDVENNGNILRFHQGLGPDAVEYVLEHEQIRFTGPVRARRPAPWTSARFKKRSGEWVPVQRAPVRYSDSAGYSSVHEFIEICTDRLLAELVEVAALEVLSALYASVAPWDALSHDEALDRVEARCVPSRRRGRWQTFRARVSSPAVQPAD